MTDQSAETEKLLHLPKFCIVPLEARLDHTLTDSAKIYLGEINVLTNKHGYCWASNEQLAKMKGVSVTTIKNWNRELKKRGFLEIDSWKEHVKEQGAKGLRIRSKRKIYVIEEPSKNVYEGQKSAPRSEGQKSAPIKEEPLIFEEENNNAAAPVVVPLSLQKLEIPDKLREKIVAEGFTDHQINVAVERALRWKTRPSDEIGIMTTLRRENDWNDNMSSEEIIEDNLEFLKTLNHLDGVKSGPVIIGVGNKYVEFIAGPKLDYYDVEQRDFKIMIKTKLKSLAVGE